MKKLTTAQAAQALGVSRARVQFLITQGRLKAERFGQVWMIPEGEVTGFVRLPKGRPATKPRREPNPAANRNPSGCKGIHHMSNTPEYVTWVEMRRRCRPGQEGRRTNYAALGITVCERWSKFEAFLEDMGPKPGPGYTIDRINGAGNYEPSNCRWATLSEQNQNKRNNRWITFRGETRCLEEWAKLLGIQPATIANRLTLYGWSVEDALTTPPHYGNRKSPHWQ